MKNLFILSAIVIGFAACNSTASETQGTANVDSTVVADTTVKDTTVTAVVADTTVKATK